ncbi:MAG: STT3 domain-containing protein [Nanoarchaeota archaeon]|nr:STT3 domain-containing protein [Nanoarchaeota archaeon]
MDDVIEQRKENMFALVKRHQSKIVWILLLIIILVGMHIRSQNFGLLKDATTGDYISAELDSTLFLRYAEYIVEHGALPAVDMMRFVPVGADLSLIGTFTSYFVAYLYYVLHTFDSSVTVAYADIVYPIVAMALSTLFLFLLVRRLLGKWVALLSALFLTIIPTFLFRSTGGSSDHDILGMLFFLMVMYLYVLAYQSSSLKKSLLFASLAAVAFVFGRNTAGTLNFALFIVGAYVLLSIVLDRFTKKDFYVYSLWLWLSMLLIQLSGKFGVLAFVNSITTGIAFVAWLFAVVDFVIFKLDVFKWRARIEQKVPLWLATLGLSAVVGSLLVLVMFGPSFFVAKFTHISQYLFRAYAETRWTLTVAENRKPFVVDWMSQMSSWFVYFFMFGAALVFHQMVRKLRHAWKLTAFFGVTLFGYVFSRYSPDTVLNGSSTLSNVLFYGCLIGIFVVLIGLFARLFFKNREEYFVVAKNIDLQYAFLVVWLLIMVVAATSAIRLLFEFSVITCILAAFFVVYVTKFFYSLKSKWLRYAGLIVLVIILVSPFSLGFINRGFVLNFYESSKYQAANTGASYNQQWQVAGKWVRDNTPEDAVFIHWWDYGYWVQQGFKRASVTDGGNFFIYWNYLVGRFLLTGDNETQAFELMKSHNVTHFLVVPDEIGKYGAFSSIGGDVNHDRFASIGVFNFNPQKTQELRDNTVFFYEGGVALYESFVYNGMVFPPSTPVGGFFVHVKDLNISQNAISFTFEKVEAAVFKDGQQYNIPLKCVYYDKRYDFVDGVMPACLRIIPQYNGNSFTPMGNALFIPPKIVNNFFGRLYLLDETVPGFKLVYSDENQGIRLGVYNGRLWGPFRIWEIEYPVGTKVNPEYLLLDYPDERLKLP